MYNDITGIILCGGKSKRMGTDKSFMKLGDRYIIEIMADLMKLIFQRVILISNDVEKYKFLNLMTYEDIFKGKGPLGGIHSGLINSDTEKIYVIACDIPLITKNAISFILNYPSEKSIKVPFADGFVQQLCGLYSKSNIELIEELLNSPGHGKCKVLELVEKADGEIIYIENQMQNYKKDTFLNLNDINSYNKAAELYSD